MRRFYKTIGRGMVCLALILGGYNCSKKESPKPQESKSQLKKIKTSYKTDQLAGRVRELSKELFPRFMDNYKGVIYLGKDAEKNSRYVIIETWGGLKMLEIEMHTHLDSKVEEEIDKYLLTNNYESAIEVLNKSNSEMVHFNDVHADGLINTWYGVMNVPGHDTLVTRDKKGKSTFIVDSELPKDVLERVNNLYKSVLETVTSTLEKELETKKEIKYQKEIRGKRVENVAQHLTKFKF